MPLTAFYHKLLFAVELDFIENVLFEVRMWFQNLNWHEILGIYKTKYCHVSKVIVTRNYFTPVNTFEIFAKLFEIDET